MNDAREMRPQNLGRIEDSTGAEKEESQRVLGFGCPDPSSTSRTKRSPPTSHRLGHEVASPIKPIRCGFTVRAGVPLTGSVYVHTLCRTLRLSACIVYGMRLGMSPGWVEIVPMICPNSRNSGRWPAPIRLHRIPHCHRLSTSRCRTKEPLHSPSLSRKNECSGPLVIHHTTVVARWYDARKTA